MRSRQDGGFRDSGFRLYLDPDAGHLVHEDEGTLVGVV